MENDKNGCQKEKDDEDAHEIHDFFISYASEDKKLAIEIKDKLKSTGLKLLG